MNCRLCDSSCCRSLFSDDLRSYCHCEKCGLIFVPESQHIGAGEEKSRYDLHDNSVTNTEYVGFLNDLADIVVNETPASALILDYGSGRNAVLTRLLQDRGCDCTAYDPLYGIGKNALEKTYDAVVLCEVVEHIRNLKKELANIKSAAGTSGKIIIRTKIYPSIENFPGWWYSNDITHINFFSRQAIAVMAEIVAKRNVEEYSGDIFILHGNS